VFICKFCFTSISETIQKYGLDFHYHVARNYFAHDSMEYPLSKSSIIKKFKPQIFLSHL